MAITYSMGSNPIWYFVDKNGKPLAGGKFYTFSQLNFPQQKLVFSDPNGVFAYPDSVIINADGTAGPFFFSVDSLNPNDTYLLFVTDANNVEIFTVENYSPGTGGGGGGTLGLNLTNLITNNIFYRHVDKITSVPTYSIVAPSNFTGLVNNGITTTNGNGSPDIVFIKNNTSSTDTLSFPVFPLGSEPIVSLTSPVDYFNYVCSVAGSGETVKILQFPITSKVQNLQNTTMSGSLWAMANGGTNSTIQLNWMQFFGDGPGASAPVVTPITTFALPNTGVWQLLNFTGVIPPVSGKQLGGPQFGGPNNDQFEGPNDGLFFQIQLPFNATSNIGITNLTLFEGTTLPENTSFQTYDQIDAIISQVRTGDVRVSLNSFVPFGWVPCNDGVIANGNPAIVLPTSVKLSRNNADTYPLYNLIWTLTTGNPSFAPIFDSAGNPVARGASAIDDFKDSKQLSLTKVLGRVLAGANPDSTAALAFTGDATTDRLTVLSVATLSVGTPIVVTGGSLPTGLVANTVYYVTNITGVTFQLAVSLDFAQAGTPIIDITANGSGTLYTSLGEFLGEGRHTQTLAELAAHQHSPDNSQAFVTSVGATLNRTGAGPGFSTTNTTTFAGSSTPFNVMQPTIFMNIFLKL